MSQLHARGIGGSLAGRMGDEKKLVGRVDEWPTLADLELPEVDWSMRSKLDEISLEEYKSLMSALIPSSKD